MFIYTFYRVNMLPRQRITETIVLESIGSWHVGIAYFNYKSAKVPKNYGFTYKIRLLFVTRVSMFTS